MIRKIKMKMLRYLRNDIIEAMRAQGFTWAKINIVLRSLGQREIAIVELLPNGNTRLIFHQQVYTHGYIKPIVKLAEHE